MAGSTIDGLSFADLQAGSKLEQTSQWISSIFQPGSALGQAFGWLNLTALVIVTGLLLLQLKADITQAAATGEEGRVSTRPLRWIIAIAGLIPLQNGLGGLQLFILWCAESGGWLASRIWQATASAVLGGAVVIAPPASQDFEMINQVVRSSACAEIYNIKSAHGGTGVALVPFTNKKFSDTRPPPPAIPLGDASGAIMPDMQVTPPPEINQAFGFAARASGLPSGVCGGLSFSVIPFTQGSGGQRMAAAAIYDASKNPYLAMLMAKTEAISTIMSDAQVLGKALAGGLIGGATPPEDGGVKALADIYIKYADALKGPAAAAMKIVNLSDEAKRVQGVAAGSSWVAAGSWYLDLMSISALTAKAATVQFDIDKPFIGAWGHASSASKRDGEEKLRAIDAAIDEAARRAGAASAAATTSDFNQLAQAIRMLTPGVNQYDGTEKSQQNGVIDPNPLASLTSYGWTLIGVGATAIGLGSVAKFLGPVSPVASMLSTIEPLGWIVLLAGLVLAIWLALRPFVEFLFGILAWLISIAVALVGSGLLMIGLLRGEDAETLGKSADKLLAVLTDVVLRPSLMVIFLVISMALFKLMVGVATWGIAPPLNAILAGGGTLGTVVGAVAAPVILALLFVVLAEKCFSLIHIGPDRALSYLTGSDSAAGITEGASNRIFTLISSTARGAPRGIGNAGSRSGAGGGAGGGRKSAQIVAEPGTLDKTDK
jgi:conjugal transfer/type IV secretion protein DotA/TraY